MMTKLETPDVFAVKSRVSWGAIFAGLIITLTVYFSVTVVGVAIGLTLAGRVDSNELSIGAGIWSVTSVLTALFLGGFVTSKSTAGETRGEALVYGILLWGLTLISLLHINLAGMSNSGFVGLINRSLTGPQATLTEQQWDENLQGQFTPEQSAAIKNLFAQSGQRMQNISATNAAWWSVVGLVASMLAAILGSLLGAGPELELRALLKREPRRVAVQTTS